MNYSVIVTPIVFQFQGPVLFYTKCIHAGLIISDAFPYAAL